ncbi:MAG: GTPase Era, partial [Betaproteobacteria bacterium]
MDEARADGFRCGHVAIVGRPSVGKSTLLNALVGERISITSKKPQTTRFRITGIVTDATTQFVFVDTPGFQTRHRSPLNDRLNRAVRESLAGVDAAVWTVDAMRLTPADRAVAALVPLALPVVAAVNKIDLVADKAKLLPLLRDIAAVRDCAAIVPVSADRGTGLDALKRAIAALLPESPPLYPADDVTDRDER